MRFGCCLLFSGLSLHCLQGVVWLSKQHRRNVSLIVRIKTVSPVVGHWRRNVLVVSFGLVNPMNSVVSLTFRSLRFCWL